MKFKNIFKNPLDKSEKIIYYSNINKCDDGK